MFIIEVIPLSRTGSIESLSYYSSITYTTGSLIEIPIRKKQVRGIVISAKPVSAAKTAIRAATFSLKKLTVQKEVDTLPESLMKTASELAKGTPAHIGSILFALLPPDMRKGQRQIPSCAPYTNHEVTTPVILQATYTDRFMAYKSHIRQAFAHRGSVLLVVPTSAAVKAAKAQLEHGIEKRVLILCHTLTKKQMEKSYEAFGDLSTARLIITTPSFALLDRSDITTIIMEESANDHYKSRTRPYLDMRDVLKTYAKVTKRTIMLGDILPRTEDEVYRRDDFYETYEEHPKRLSFDNTFTVSQHVRKEGEKDFALFTPEVTSSITRAIKGNKRVFLFAARKGLAPLVLCYDCGHIFRCPDSGAPYSLLETNKDDDVKRWFVSSTSGKKIRAADTCPDCGSWRLREQGIGIQQVVSHARKLFKNTPITIFDHTTATTHLKAKKLAKQFYDTKGGIMIGTSMALPYITTPVAITAITSYEAARAIPTWRAEETLLKLLLNLRDKTTDTCFVQTRTETDYILKYAQKGLTDEFYDEEIMMRKTLSYPPYTYFVLLTWAGTQQQILETEKYIRTQLTNVDIQFYNAPLTTKQGIIRHALIRIDATQWPNKQLIDQLRHLPPMIKVEVSPDKII